MIGTSSRARSSRHSSKPSTSGRPRSRSTDVGRHVVERSQGVAAAVAVSRRRSPLAPDRERAVTRSTRRPPRGAPAPLSRRHGLRGTFTRSCLSSRPALAFAPVRSEVPKSLSVPSPVDGPPVVNATGEPFASEPVPVCSSGGPRISRNAASSAGSGSSNEPRPLPYGCGKTRRPACRNGRPRSSPRDDSRPPYAESPTTGWPIAARWTRIWWVRPVSSVQASSADSGSAHVRPPRTPVRDGRPASRTAIRVDAAARRPMGASTTPRRASTGCPRRPPCTCDRRRAMSAATRSSYEAPVRATTSRPLVSRSSRCTIPGRAGSPTEAISGKRARSPWTSVPCACPAPGWTTSPAGLSTTITSSSAWRTSTGTSSATGSSATSGTLSSSTSSPAAQSVTLVDRARPRRGSRRRAPAPGPRHGSTR